MASTEQELERTFAAWTEITMMMLERKCSPKDVGDTLENFIISAKENALSAPDQSAADIVVTTEQ